MLYNSVAFIFRAYQVHPIENGIFSCFPTRHFQCSWNHPIERRIAEIPDRRHYTEMYVKSELRQLRRKTHCVTSETMHHQYNWTQQVCLRAETLCNSYWKTYWSVSKIKFPLKRKGCQVIVSVLIFCVRHLGTFVNASHIGIQ